MSKNEVDELAVRKVPALKFYQAGSKSGIEMILQKSESAILTSLKEFTTFDWVEPTKTELKQEL